MKKLIPIFGLFALGLAAFVYEYQAKAQPSQSGSQLTPMNIPSGPPADNPKGRDPRFPPPASPRFSEPKPSEIPTGDVGEEVVKKRAIKKAVAFGEGNPKAIKTSKLRYKEAIELWPEPKEFGEVELPDLPVYLVEVEGTFTPRTSPPRVKDGRKDSRPLPTFKKGYFIIRAADGKSLGVQLSNK